MATSRPFGELVDRYRGAVFGLASNRLKDFDEAKDVAQEALIEACLKLETLREPAKFSNWLYTIAVNLCRMGLRQKRGTTLSLDELHWVEEIPGQRKILPRPLLHSEPKTPEEEYEAKALRASILAAIGTLPPKCREAVILYYMDGLSYRDIADFLAVSVSTVRGRLQHGRRRLREEMITMIEKTFEREAPREEFREEVLSRIGHWERFPGSDEEKLEMVKADPEWCRLVTLETALEPMSFECREIRKQIASMEACHEHYVDNVKAVLSMIGSMRPGRVLDCGEACELRRHEASAYLQALQAWQHLNALPGNPDAYTREVFDLLGARTDAKLALVEHLIGKLQDNGYRVYADEDEDFELTQSRIHHLAVCNYNWQENLRIVLQEIAAGNRLFEWHVPDGYNAHGDCPDRVSELQKTMASVTAWAEGRKGEGGEWAGVLGQPTPEKRWLAASLCKHVSRQHRKYDGEQLLARPSL